MVVINGIEYEKLDLKHWPLNEQETTDEFEKKYAEESSKITHWLCDESEPSLNVLEGNVYEVKTIEANSEKDIYIIDDSGSPSMVWIMLEGTFLIKKNDKESN